MSHDLICSWLGLPAGVWPPDHYKLLDLNPGEPDQNLIEERVHQRLDTVRRYQMTHAEEATEAMTRIAQAFVCLSEPASKRVYDVALLGPAAAPETPPDAIPVAEPVEPLVLVYNPTGAEAAPPPVRRTGEPQGSETIPVATVAVIDALPAELPPIRVEPKRQVYRSLAQARRLIELWNQAGKFLASPKRRLARTAEIDELLRVLNDVRKELETFAQVMGAPGQPGHAVLSLLELTPPQFPGLTATQREALTQDWQAGQKLLDEKKAYLRGEAQAMRRRTVGQKLGRIVRTTIMEKPGRVLIAVAVLAVNIAVFRTYVLGWLEHLVRSALEMNGR